MVSGDCSGFLRNLCERLYYVSTRSNYRLMSVDAQNARAFGFGRLPESFKTEYPVRISFDLAIIFSKVRMPSLFCGCFCKMKRIKQQRTQMLALN